MLLGASKQLAAFPADTLYETIPCFHDTPKRLSDFQKAVSEDTCGRVKTVAEEIEFILEQAPFTTILAHAYAEGDIPLRVTHNDTKLNNIMFDSNTRKPLCILDLDTVMPGFSATDFEMPSGSAPILQMRMRETYPLFTLTFPCIRRLLKDFGRLRRYLDAEGN